MGDAALGRRAAGPRSGKFDMVAGPATITKARMERYRFSMPVAEATVALLKQAGDDSLTKPEDIAGKAVGSGKATAQLAQLQEYAATLPAPGRDQGIRRASTKPMPISPPAASWRWRTRSRTSPSSRSSGPETFAVVEPPFGAKTYFGFPGRKDADYASLMDAIDAALLKMKADGRLAEIQKKWFGVSFDTPDKMTEAAF